MKKIHLTLHIFPREIDDYEFTINQLKVASKLIQNLQIDANVILNLNDKIIDWDNATLPKEYFVERFKHINKKLDWITNLEEEITYKQEYHGYLEKRVSNTKLEGYDLFWWQDVDLILDDLLFYGLENILENITEDNYIISPQIYKFWDSSWDVLSSNPQDIIDIDTFDAFNIKINQYNREQIELIQNKDIKFAGGWFTMISDKLIKNVPFPVGIKGYGREDTLVQEWAKKINATQYIMKGLYVQENRYYLSNSIYSKYIPYNTEYLATLNEESKNKFYQILSQL
jgi:hypothetical protein